MPIALSSASRIARRLSALDSVCPPKGPLFREVDYRYWLRRAAEDIAMDDHRAERLSLHDFRHARTTLALEKTKNLAGVAYLVGHRNITTTNKYAKPSQRAAEAAHRDIFGPPTGHKPGDGSDDT